MKKLFFISFFTLSFFSYSQSITEGTISITAIGGLTSGSVKDDFDCTNCNDNRIDYRFSSGTYGLNFQYGLNDTFSVGLNVSYGSYLLTKKILQIQDFTNLQSILGIAQTMELYSGAIEARYYLYNTNKYNAFIGPSIGFSSATDKFVGFDLSAKQSLNASGINYGLKGGVNYFLDENKNIGVVLHASYEAMSLSGDSSSENVQMDLKRTISGFNILTGLVINL